MELLRYAVKNIGQRKLRSVLTTLSILVGIMAIFAILSFGLGLQDYVDSMAQQAGADKFFLRSKGMGTSPTGDEFAISSQDIDFISRLTEVERISGMYTKSVRIQHDDQQAYTMLYGMDADMQEFVLESFNTEALKGRMLREGALDEVVAGYSYTQADEVFDSPMKVGDKIELGGKRFEAEGFLEEIGNPMDDKSIYVTRDGFESAYPEEAESFGYAIGQAKRDVDVTVLADKIEEEFREYKGIEEGEENFYVQTMADTLEAFNSTLNILLVVLILIALISMIVASVNIANAMYTSVIERTREIGVMKALGAPNRSILWIFLFESAILGLIGGLMGVIMGYIAAEVGGQIAANAGYSLLSPAFPPVLIIGSLVFSTFVGAMAGLLPARQAANLNPVDALRSEE